MHRCRLHITGASGSGTTTLAREVATAWGAPHADTDDYLWLPSDPPFTQQRPRSERVALMQAVFVPREAWVLSGSMLGWGDAVIECCDAVVFLTLDSPIRLQRIRRREQARRAAGPVDEDAFAAFVAWAGNYEDPDFDGLSRARHDAWLANLPCPVLRLESSRSPEALRHQVLAWEPTR